MPLYTPRCDTRARCPCTPLADKPPPASVLSPRIGCCWLNTQLINNNLQACIRETDPFRATYMYLYPTLQISPNSYTNAAALSSALLDGTCPAILAPQSYVMNWARNPVNCPLRVKDQRARYTGDRMIGSRRITMNMHMRSDAHARAYASPCVCLLPVLVSHVLEARLRCRSLACLRRLGLLSGQLVYPAAHRGSAASHHPGGPGGTAQA